MTTGDGADTPDRDALAGVDGTGETASYESLGGAAFFADFTREFYALVAADPVLSAMYPEDDMAGAERRLRLFLEQYWGGPTTYNEVRGHPKLRMRHMPFPIDSVARDRWLVNMHDAVVEQNMPTELETELWTYFVGAAFAMQNIVDENPGAIAVDEA